MRAHLVTDAGGFLRYLEIPGEEPPILWLHGLLCASTSELAPVAAQRPDAVDVLIMADANLEPHEGAGSVSNSIAGQPYEQFATSGLPGLISRQEQAARQDPGGLTAAHLGMVRILSAHGVHRSAQSLARGTDPTVRALVKGLGMPRFYLYSEFGVLSDAELEARKDLEASGVEYVMVPGTGHQMGLQNPKGFALKVAEAIGQAATPRPAT